MELNFEELKKENLGKTEVNYGKIFQDSYICPSEEMKPAPVAISIGDSIYKGNIYPLIMGSYGDFSCIVGASKSRKTFFLSMIHAGYIGGVRPH